MICMWHVARVAGQGRIYGRARGEAHRGWVLAVALCDGAVVEGLAPLILGGSLSLTGGLFPADSLCQMLCSTGLVYSRARAVRTYMRGGVKGTIVPESAVWAWRLPR